MDFRLFSPDGRWIAVNDWDSSVLIWDPATGRQVARLNTRPVNRIPADLIYAAASPAGPIVVVKGDGGLNVWDIAAGRRLATLPPARQICGDAAGRWLACRDDQGVVTIFDPAIGRTQQLPSRATGLAVDADGRHLYLWDEHQMNVVRWPNGSLEIAATFPRAVPVERVLLDRNGTRPAVVRKDGSLVRLDMQGPELRPSLTGGPDLRWLLSPGGHVVAVASSTDIELIDMTQPEARASMTLDGRIFGMTWIQERSLVLAGAFGIQAIALKGPGASSNNDFEPPANPVGAPRPAGYPRWTYLNR
jgi:WD40 repeat protein